jgi:hypothetical protein
MDQFPSKIMKSWERLHGVFRAQLNRSKGFGRYWRQFPEQPNSHIDYSIGADVFSLRIPCLKTTSKAISNHSRRNSEGR